MTNTELVSICFIAVWVIGSKNIEAARALNELIKGSALRNAPDSGKVLLSEKE